MTFESRWMVNTDEFTIKIQHLGAQIRYGSPRTDGCLIKVTSICKIPACCIILQKCFQKEGCV